MRPGEFRQTFVVLLVMRVKCKTGTIIHLDE